MGKKIIKELAPELADKIIMHLSKPIVLHHLKQLKAQLGKELKPEYPSEYRYGIQIAMGIIDKKIVKINAQ